MDIVSSLGWGNIAEFSEPILRPVNGDTVKNAAPQADLRHCAASR
jgi:hypothetical protein